MISRRYGVRSVRHGPGSARRSLAGRNAQSAHSETVSEGSGAMASRQTWSSHAEPREGSRGRSLHVGEATTRPTAERRVSQCPTKPRPTAVGLYELQYLVVA
jgi:hypothetical protein